jgi:hypothetical protein
MTCNCRPRPKARPGQEDRMDPGDRTWYRGPGCRDILRVLVRLQFRGRRRLGFSPNVFHPIGTCIAPSSHACNVEHPIVDYGSQVEYQR